MSRAIHLPGETRQPATTARNGDRAFLRCLWLTVLCLLFCISSAAQPAQFVAGQILVKPRSHLPDSVLAGRLKSHGASTRHTLGQGNIHVVTLPEVAADAVLAALRSDRDIEFAERDYLAHASFVPNDPLVSSGAEWHLARIQALPGWDITIGRADVVVAVLDSGVNAAHEDLAGQLLPGYDFVWNDAQPADDFGHGTAVTGTVVASANNGVGVAGVAPGCRVLPVKVMDASGVASHSTIAQGIEYAVQQGARIINLSMGGDWPSSTLQSAIDYAWSNNVIVVAAAGNNGNSVPQYPAACDHVVAVGATAPDDSRAWFSSYGSFVMLFAPGETIWTTKNDLANPYAPGSGTSFSSPIVAGVAALITSADPSLSSTQVVELLKQSADDLGVAGYDTMFGYGRVNALRAASLASTGTEPQIPEQTPLAGGQSNLTTWATMLTTNLAGLKGTYTGLVADTNGVAPESCGYFLVKVTGMGRFSGKLLLGGTRRGFSGDFNSSGEATINAFGNPLSPLQLTLRIDLSNGGEQIFGQVTSSASTCELSGARNVFDSRLNPAQQAGLRAFALERTDAGAAAIAVASTRISSAGAAKIHGKRGDGHAFSASSTIARNGNYPFYLSINRGSEVLIGWLTFSAGQIPTTTGSVLWLKRGTNGFSASLEATTL